jgi:hypothetical protein
VPAALRFQLVAFPWDTAGPPPNKNQIGASKRRLGTEMIKVPLVSK